MQEKVTTNEILDVLVKFADSTQKQFDSLGADVAVLKTDMNRVMSQMVTKSYLDDKLANLRGDIVKMVDCKIAKACS